LFIFNIYYTGDEIKDDEIRGTGDKPGRRAYRDLVERREDKRPPGRSVCRYNDNIKMGLKEMRCFRVWSALIWLRTGTSGGLL
jgi:hypothetical protein